MVGEEGPQIFRERVSDDAKFRAAFQNIGLTPKQINDVLKHMQNFYKSVAQRKEYKIRDTDRRVEDVVNTVISNLKSPAGGFTRAGYVLKANSYADFLKINPNSLLIGLSVPPSGAEVAAAVPKRTGAFKYTIEATRENMKYSYLISSNIVLSKENIVNELNSGKNIAYMQIIPSQGRAAQINKSSPYFQTNYENIRNLLNDPAVAMTIKNDKNEFVFFRRPSQI